VRTKYFDSLDSFLKAYLEAWNIETNIEGPPWVSPRDYFAEYHRGLLSLGSCGWSVATTATTIMRDIFVHVIRRISSGMNFCRATSCPLAAILITKLCFSTLDVARRPRDRLRDTRNHPGTKTRSSLNRLFTDWRTAHNICRVCQSLHLKERD